eukprot:2495792-Rhodomonas_salina.1
MRPLIDHVRPTTLACTLARGQRVVDARDNSAALAANPLLAMLLSVNFGGVRGVLDRDHCVCLVGSEVGLGTE